MAVYKCKVCSADVELTEGVIATCSCCGTRQAFPRYTDEAHIDRYNKGNALRAEGKLDEANLEIRPLLVDDPQDPEGYWCRMLCRYGITYEKSDAGAYVPVVGASVDAPIFDDKDYKHAYQKSAGEQRDLYQAAAEEIESVHRVKRYQSACILEKAAGLDSTRRAKELFEGLGDYEDSAEHLAACNEALVGLEAVGEKKRKGRDRRFVAAVVIVVVIALMIPATTMLIIPGMRYNTATQQLADGNYHDAIATFMDLGSFSDSADMAVKAKKARSDASLTDTQVGDSVYLGSYEQDDILIDGLESLEWRCLAVENGKALIVTVKTIDAHVFNEDVSSGNDFATSDLRTWLNGDFKNTAFDSDEQSTISGEVSILTRAQIEKYFSNYADRVADCTDYAVAHAVWRNDTTQSRYWIDDVDPADEAASSVGPSGAIDTDHLRVSDSRGGVRPCLWVTLK